MPDLTHKQQGAMRILQRCYYGLEGSPQRAMLRGIVANIPSGTADALVGAGLAYRSGLRLKLTDKGRRWRDD